MTRSDHASVSERSGKARVRAERRSAGPRSVQSSSTLPPGWRRLPLPTTGKARSNSAVPPQLDLHHLGLKA